MRTLQKLTLANIKMYFRDKGALFWSLFFPFIIIALFGVFDFAKLSASKIGIVYDEDTRIYAEAIKDALANVGEQYKIEEGNIENEKQSLIDDDRLLVLEFSKNPESQKVNVKAYLNKSNETGAQIVYLVIQQVLSEFELQLSQIEPVFDISQETINVFELKIIDFMVPGVIALSLMQGGTLGVIGTIVNYREKGVLKRLFATPLPKWIFLMAQILSRLVISVLQVVILLTTSYFMFKIKIVGSLFLVALFSIIGSLAFLTLGFVISGLAKTSETARAIIMPIQMLMMFTSGVYFEREVLPNWLFNITSYLPLTYLADGLRYIMTRGYSLANMEVREAFIGISVWFVILVAAAIKTFKWER